MLILIAPTEEPTRRGRIKFCCFGVAPIDWAQAIAVGNCVAALLF